MLLGDARATVTQLCPVHAPSSHTGLPGHGSAKRDALSGLDSGDCGGEMGTKAAAIVPASHRPTQEL